MPEPAKDGPVLEALRRLNDRQLQHVAETAADRAADETAKPVKAIYTEVSELALRVLRERRQVEMIRLLATGRSHQY